MLGALLSEMATIHTQPFPEDSLLEDENEDNHWASDDNLFEDWLLHAEDASAVENEPDVFY